MENRLNVFGRTIIVEYEIDCRNAIEALEILKEEIKKPQITSSKGYAYINFGDYTCRYNLVYTDDILRWLAGDKSIADFIKENTTEEISGKITLNKNIQKKIAAHADEKIKELSDIRQKLNSPATEREKDDENR